MTDDDDMPDLNLPATWLAINNTASSRAAMLTEHVLTYKHAGHATGALILFWLDELDMLDMPLDDAMAALMLLSPSEMANVLVESLVKLRDATHTERQVKRWRW